MEVSSFIKFVRKIKGSGWNRIKVHREFLKQVDRNDYAKEDKAELYEWCEKVANKAHG